MQNLVTIERIDPFHRESRELIKKNHVKFSQDRT